MSNPRYDLRIISFPYTPGTFTETRTTTEYLKYLLPFTSTLHVKDSPLDTLITKTFLYNELLIKNSIEDADPESASYNKPRIDSYIKRDFFTEIPITDIQTTQTDPAISYNGYTVSTSKTLRPQIENPIWAGREITGGFKRGNTVCYTIQENGEVNSWYVSECNLTTGHISDLYSFPDVGDYTTDGQEAPTQPVIDSHGDIYSLVLMNNTNGALPSYAVLAKKTVDPLDSSKFYMETDPALSLTAIDYNLTDFSFNHWGPSQQMVIDEDDIKYVLSEFSGLWKIDEAGNTMVNITAIELNVSSNYNFYGVVYDIVSKTFWLSTMRDNGDFTWTDLVVNLAKDGTVISNTPVAESSYSGIVGNTAVTAAYTTTSQNCMQFSTTTTDGRFDYSNLYEWAGTYTNNSPNPYFDTDEFGDADLSSFKGFVIPYDMSEPIYVIDSVDDSIYYEDVSASIQQDTQGVTPLNYLEIAFTPYGYTADQTKVTYEMKYNGVWSTVTSFLGETENSSNIIYPYSSITKDLIHDITLTRIVIWNGSVPDNTPETGIMHAEEFRVTIVHADKTIQYPILKDTVNNTYYVNTVNQVLIAIV